MLTLKFFYNNYNCIHNDLIKQASGAFVCLLYQQFKTE